VTQKLPFGWRFVKCNARVATATAGRASLRWRDIRQFENTSLSGFRSKAGGKSKCMTKPIVFVIIGGNWWHFISVIWPVSFSIFFSASAAMN
jgi:hypothetical protein